MATFVLNIIRDEDPKASKAFSAVCSILGEGTGFDGSIRHFEHELDMINAFERIGIQPERYAVALKMVLSGKQGSFDLDQNEAQKLCVLHTNSSE